MRFGKRALAEQRRGDRQAEEFGQLEVADGQIISPRDWESRWMMKVPSLPGWAPAHGIYLKASRSTVLANKITHFHNEGVSVRYRDSAIARSWRFSAISGK